MTESMEVKIKTTMKRSRQNSKRIGTKSNGQERQLVQQSGRTTKDYIDDLALLELVST
jgi:hypothetical protein